MKTSLFAKNLWIVLALVALLPLAAACSPNVRVGAMQSESQSVDLGNEDSVRVEISFGAGDLKLSGGAEKLLEADFNYNVSRLKPEVKYSDGKLVIHQPGTSGLPALSNVGDFRNEWDLHLNQGVPMDLEVDMGGGTSDLQLAGLPLTKLNISLGAGQSTIDLRGDWAQDLDVSIDSGAGDLTVLLPEETGVRVVVDTGPTLVSTSGLEKDENVYTNDAYGESAVTLRIDLDSGIGHVDLDAD